MSFFSFVGLTGHVAGAAVFADDHPFVDLVAGRDEHFGPILQAVEPEGHGLAGDHRDQHAVGRGRRSRLPAADSVSKRWCMTAVPCVALSSRVRRPISPRAGIENSDVRITRRGCAFRPFGRAGRRPVPSPAPACRAALRPPAFRTALRSRRSRWCSDDPRLADRQLIAFAAHRLDQHRQVQQAAARDGERIGARRSARRAGRRSSPARCISRSRRWRLVTILALAAGQRRSVDARRPFPASAHRLRSRGKAAAIVGVADRVADLDVFQARPRPRCRRRRPLRLRCGRACRTRAAATTLRDHRSDRRPASARLAGRGGCVPD